MTTAVEKGVIFELLKRWKGNASNSLLVQAAIYRKQSKIEVVSQGNSKLSVNLYGGGYLSSLFRVNLEEKDCSLYCSCSCHSYYGCSHLAAVVLEVLENPSLIKGFYEVSVSFEEQQWLDSLKEEPPVLKVSDGVVAYVLEGAINSPSELSVGFSAAKQKKNKEFKGSAVKKYTIGQMSEWPESIKRHLEAEDWEIIQMLLQDKIKSDVDSATLMKKLIKTGRCFYKEVHPTPLSWGKSRKGSFEWGYDSNRNQRIHFTAEPGVSYFVLSTGAIYVDMQESSIGTLELPTPIHIVKSLLKSPVIQPRKASLIQRQLSSVLKDVKVKEKPLIEVSGVSPVPHLTIHNSPSKPFEIEATLSFGYGESVVPYEKGVVSISTISGSKAVYRVTRDLQTEKIAALVLKEYGFDADYESSKYILLLDKSIEFEAVKFIRVFIDKRRVEGWVVTFSDSFPIQNIYESEEWYADTSESPSESSNDWFDLELGTVIDGKKVNLIPALRKLMMGLSEKNFRFDDLTEEQLQEKIALSLNSKDVVMIPIFRLKNIFNAFFGFLENSDGAEKLKVSKWNAPAMGDLQDGFQGKLEWQAPEQYKQLKELLLHTKKIEQVALPKGLKCELRAYQLEGVSWLQFLRASNLAGILADDMGLGKTIQTLAHILLEKESGRMEKPTLVIAPTSLMGNWLKEAERFAPELKVLILQGDERKKHFDRIYDFDLILTTYPLLARDQETLLKHEFHLLILDEAQNVKNAKTQAHGILRKIQVKHKLCLTGTPIENHLGELWSFFHILLPGFLGEEKQFQQLFRKPIEKEGSLERKRILQKRIHPFMLRRTKGEVALDLPPKTEIITQIEPSSKQKDLYEAVRLTMMEKVLAEVEDKGLSRSRIIVLDALLKLRQTCCDPRLVKSAKEEYLVEDSAKLSHLMEMIPSLIEEGRQILLFSQFTSMLALIEKELKALSIPYTMITGDTKDRMTPVEEFQAGKKALMLISLKAGGTGLNLTAADTVIHYDPWWNPAVENQATDRAHRIGQTKPVFVYKFITTGSVEEKILRLQTRKKELAEGLFDSTSTAPLDMNLEDLHALFEPLKV